MIINIQSPSISTALLLFAATLALPANAHESTDHKHPAPFPEAEAHRPTPLPDRVVLTWTGDPATSQAVTWRTATGDSPALAQIQPATHGPLPSVSNAIPAVSQELESDLGKALYHTVEFTGLLPDTLYAYRVGDGTNWSEWFHFKTASDRERPFSFIYVGDAQNDLKTHWSRLIREAFSEAPRAAFTLHAGDLINNALNDAQWGEWFSALGWVNATLPVVATPGNHEYYTASGSRKDGNAVRELGTHWRPQFAFPKHGPAEVEETCYTFDYQGACFIVLNSNENIDKQTEWLKAVLENNTQAWTIITFHHPIFNPAPDRGKDAISIRRREAWKPLFDQYKVDLVLTGHDHTYARSGLENVPVGYPAKQDVENGTVYVVSVSGPKMYASSGADWIARAAEDTQLYQVISIAGDTLTYEARTATNLLYDKFTLIKQSTGPNLLMEHLPDEKAFRRTPSEKATE